MSNHCLQDILTKIDDMSQHEQQVSVDDVLSVIGRRSFGPLLVFIGVVLALPGVGDIPGVPIIFGGMILLTVGQQFVGRSHIWLPDWLLQRSIKQDYVHKTLSYTEKPARFIDSITSKRLSQLVDNNISWYVSALACLSIAVLTPAMTVVIFSANIAGICLFLFGLAYLARDGLIMLVSFLLYAGLLSLLVWGLFL